MNAVTNFHYPDGSPMPLSNFYRSKFVWRDIEWPSGEHAYQAAKCVPDNLTHHQIWAAKTPGEAKKLGRRAQLRPDWEQVKIGIMREVLEAKFPADSVLGEWLLATGDQYLIEGNTWGDRFWGVDTSDWTGENWLGLLLVNRRAELRAGVS